MNERAHSGGTGRRLWLHVFLFLATCVTTTAWGALYAGAPLSQWWRGLAFSGPLLAILLTHEMAHYLTATKHRIAVSLPYFIPFPSGPGTLWAVISMREPISDRNALVDVGASGPLAGLVVAVAVLAVGLAHSPVETIPLGAASSTEGNSLLYLLLKRAVLGEWLPAGRRDVFLSPTAFAGWIGLLVTMINLIPVGQLDGGHVAFAVFGDRYERFSRLVHRSLPLLAVGVVAWVTAEGLRAVQPTEPSLLEPTWRLWPLLSTGQALGRGVGAALPWLVWPLLLSFLKRASRGRYHPPVGPGPLHPSRRAVAILVAVVFVLIFTPIPMR